MDYTPQTRDGLLLAFAAAILIHVILLLVGIFLESFFILIRWKKHLSSTPTRESHYPHCYGGIGAGICDLFQCVCVSAIDSTMVPLPQHAFRRKENRSEKDTFEY